MTKIQPGGPSPAMSGEPENKTPDKPRKKTPSKIYLLISALIIPALIFTAVTRLGNQEPETKTYTEITDTIGQYAGAEATLTNTGNLTITREGETPVTTVVPTEGVDQVARELSDAGVNVTVTPPAPRTTWLNLVGGLLPAILIIGFLLFFLTRSKGGIPGLGLGKRHSEPVTVPDTTLADVKGAQEAVSDMGEVVDFLNNPEKFAKAGARAPHGLLLAGPPGTGKTLLARAVAGQAGVPFFAIAGSDMIEMFAGLGASRVRQLFSKARESGKAIIFIDEIDAIGRERGSSLSAPTNDEREQTLNALLVEMDGFAKDTSVVVIAATNRVDVLDKALLRPGRFDRTVAMPAPDIGGRQELFELYLSQKKTDHTINANSLAKRTSGLTGADIEQVVNEAALEAARNDRDQLTYSDLENALATSMLGKARTSAVLTEHDREIIAWHEAGHTVAALRVPGAQKPVTVSIIPRGGAGGATWMEGSDNLFATRKEHQARLVVAMAGRAAEEQLLEGDYTFGAHGDLQSATALAAAMVSQFGMGDTYRSVPEDITYTSGHLADTVDQQVQDLIKDALDTARETVKNHKDLLQAIAHELLNAETLTAKDLEKLNQQYR